MGPWATLKLSLRALLRNKLRSFLTALGIIIGVLSVVAMVAIGEGAKNRVAEAFASMGTNLLIVMPGSSSAGGARGGFGSQPSLTWDDLKAIPVDVPTVALAAPVLRTNAQIIGDEQNWSTQVQGTTPAYFQIRRWAVSRGVALTDSDLESSGKVVVLGQTVVDKLFGPSSDPVGSLVRIKGVPFQVVGVLERKGQSTTGQDYDDGAFVPVSTFRARLQPALGNYLAGTIFVSVREASDTARAQKQITALLRDRHRLTDAKDDDFSIRNLAEMASAQEEGAQTISTLLAIVAAVSLLVGGIGIMNIMLVSVTERTREIGIRMAVGATPAQVAWQFLAEAVTLSMVGGLLGVALGVVVAEVVASKTGWPVLFRPEVFAISVGFSALVGISFGLYPALKASQLDPIVALRFE